MQNSEQRTGARVTARIHKNDIVTAIHLMRLAGTLASSNSFAFRCADFTNQFHSTRFHRLFLLCSDNQQLSNSVMISSFYIVRKLLFFFFIIRCFFGCFVCFVACDRCRFILFHFNAQQHRAHQFGNDFWEFNYIKFKIISSSSFSTVHCETILVNW